ncbi:MAG TPA: glycosyltransferase [Mycobacteriales bacterium]|nr:glycosyltransferase [Mycobacteriales bacterium]
MQLSVITPVAAGRDRWLPDAAASVDATRALLADAGIDLEWILCHDGAPGGATRPPGEARADKVVGWHTRRGVSAARNAALAVATGDWVTPLDADDQLNPAGVLAAATTVLQAPGSMGWLGGNRLLLADGSRTPHWHDQPADYPAGRLAEAWTSPFPFHPNSVLFRRTALLRAGGWPALGVNEDLAAVLLVSEATDGRAEVHVLTHYRVWDGQEVATSTYTADKQTAFTAIEAILNAHRAAAGRRPVTRPAAGPAHGRISTHTAGPPRPE